MDLEKESGQYKTLRGLSRGLNLLRVMNTVENGQVDISELSRRTKLHRATVRRLLETLIAEGFVRRSDSDGSYRLTLQVRELSEGFTDVEWISKIASPIMGELMLKVQWPSDLSTLNGDAMLIRETTHRFSPLSFHRSMVGRRLPILLTASGRAYFCSCEEQEREEILQVIRSGNDEQAILAKDVSYIRNLRKKVDSHGFASNEGDWLSEKRVGAIALPIMSNNRVLASLNVVYLSRAMSTEDAIKKYGKALSEAVFKINQLVKDSQSFT